MHHQSYTAAGVSLGPSACSCFEGPWTWGVLHASAVLLQYNARMYVPSKQEEQVEVSRLM